MNPSLQAGGEYCDFNFFKRGGALATAIEVTKPHTDGYTYFHPKVDDFSQLFCFLRIIMVILSIEIMMLIENRSFFLRNNQENRSQHARIRVSSKKGIR
jgi:hypothetical protein